MYTGLCLGGPLHGQIASSLSIKLITPIDNLELPNVVGEITDGHTSTEFKSVTYEYKKPDNMPFGVFILDGVFVTDAMSELMKLYLEKDYTEVDNETVVGIIEPATQKSYPKRTYSRSLSEEVLKNIQNAGFRVVCPIGEPGQQPDGFAEHGEELEALLILVLRSKLGAFITNEGFYSSFVNDVFEAMKSVNIKLSK